MPIYMKYTGIDGDTTAEGHASWIDCGSFTWGVGRGISSPTGGSADRESSAPSISEITITKNQDNATVKLLQAALEGEGVEVTIDFCKTDKGKLETYLQYTLENTMVSGYSVSSGGDRPAESLSLNFTKVRCKLTSMTSSNADGSPENVAYDLSLAKIV